MNSGTIAATQAHEKQEVSSTCKKTHSTHVDTVISDSATGPFGDRRRIFEWDPGRAQGVKENIRTAAGDHVCFLAGVGLAGAHSNSTCCSFFPVFQ